VLGGWDDRNSLLPRGGRGDPAGPRYYAAGPSPASIAAGGGDGWTDLVVVNNLGSGKSTLSVLLND
jgi:hypothetical protein